MWMMWCVFWRAQNELCGRPNLIFKRHAVLGPDTFDRFAYTSAAYFPAIALYFLCPAWNAGICFSAAHGVWRLIVII